MKPWERYFWPVLTALVFLIIWHFGVIWSHTSVFPSPLDVQRGMAELVRKGLLWGYIRDSLFRVGVGYGLAIVLGIPLGILLGWYPAPARALNPVIQMMRPISPLAW